ADTYQSGGLAYRLPSLVAGLHTLKLIAWDNVGNSSTSTLTFTITEDKTFTILNLVNYPNPVQTHSSIRFQIIEPAQRLQVAVNLYTLEGKCVGQTKKTFTNTGSFIDFPFDINIAKLSTGIYFYRLEAINEKGERAVASERMVVQ
ncbi:MAG: T9SS type A sorting domain-containing protein, partial [Ferruginibacter sp.]|nr:T9SS type A sorting domain-containing protein [Ferruginibacter sp.]